MSRLWNILRIAVPAVGAACLLSPIASARTIHAVSGSPAIGSSASCFNDVLPTGVRNVCASAQAWMAPVDFDTAGAAGAKRLIVRGSGSLQCTYFGVDAAGVFIGSVGLPTNVLTPLPVVPPGSFGRVRCLIGASSTGTFIGIDYAAP